MCCQFPNDCGNVRLRPIVTTKLRRTLNGGREGWCDLDSPTLHSQSATRSFTCKQRTRVEEGGETEECERRKEKSEVAKRDVVVARNKEQIDDDPN
jgi:3-mercaptopyruvate sulfurtransferase SseA